MGNIAFWDYSRGNIIPIGSMTEEYPGCYLDREEIVNRCYNNGHQNPEWDIQQKIKDNEDGYFDFSKNMIDVGAYIGIYRWDLPFKKAWLFEPNVQSYMLCCANTVLHNMMDSTYVYCELLSNIHEEVAFNGYDGLDHKEFQKYVEDIGDWNLYYEKPTMMRTTTLDDHIDEFENVGFIKTDCEGMDWKVLDGGRKTIEKLGYPPILFENWPEYDDNNYYGPGWNNHETEDEINTRNTKIREVLSELGYEILWQWVPSHPDTHLAIHKN